MDPKRARGQDKDVGKACDGRAEEGVRKERLLLTLLTSPLS